MNDNYCNQNYQFKNEEIILRNKINNLINHCEFLFYDDFKIVLNLNNEEFLCHVYFVIEKLNYYLNILKKYIENELNKQYNSFIFIIDFNNFFNMYIKNDIEFQRLNYTLDNLNKMKNNLIK